MTPIIDRRARKELRIKGHEANERFVI